MCSENVEVPAVEVKPEKPPRVIKSIKCWSESKQKYYYKAQPAYYREFYHKKKAPQVCQYCLAVVNSSLSHHQNGIKCKLQQQVKELEDKVKSLDLNEVSTD